MHRALGLLGLGVVVAAGCYNSGGGADPDDKKPYFPVGVAVSDSGNWLFVASSNFDLRYNAGTVLALDVRKIADRARACAVKLAVNEGDPCKGGETSIDGRDTWDYFAGASVRIGAFAADMTATQRHDAAGAIVAGAGRLLLPVRGDASVTAIDYDETASGITLRCAGSTQQFGGRCASGWRLGTDAGKSDRGLVLEGEPFGIAVPSWIDPNSESGKVGGIAAVVHQSSGNVSLFVDATSQGQPPPGSLAYVLTGLAGGGTSIASLDELGGFPRFLVTNRTQSNALVVQFFPDPQKKRSAVVLADVVPITPQASGYDTRGVVVDPPNAGETRPTRVFLTNRTPAALVVGQVDPTSHKLSFYENLALPVGPSRITRAVIDGKTMILAASFDARSIVVYDPDARRITNVTRTHRGPYAMTVDSAKKLAFTCNFTDNTVQVVELDSSKPGYQRVIYSVGVPSGPTR